MNIIMDTKRRNNLLENFNQDIMYTNNISEYIDSI